jgi:hypothetical protein
MSYYKPGIGKSPFFTNNSPIYMKHENCQELKKQLESLDIIAVVQPIKNGCSVISPIPCKECLDTLCK